MDLTEILGIYIYIYPKNPLINHDFRIEMMEQWSFLMVI